MTDQFWRDGDTLPDERPGMFDANGKMMYGGWFAEKAKQLTPEELTHLEHYRATAIRAVEDVYERALTSGELPHSMNVTAYFDRHYEGQDIRINGGDDDAEEATEDTPDDIPDEIATFVREEVNRLLPSIAPPDAEYTMDTQVPTLGLIWRMLKELKKGILEEVKTIVDGADK